MHDFIARFRGAYLADFSLAFLGFGIFRFWYQYNLYNLHATTDYGVGVAWVNVVRGVVCLALTALMFGRDPSLRVRSALVWGSFALMTVSAGFNLSLIHISEPTRP